MSVYTRVLPALAMMAATGGTAYETAPAMSAGNEKRRAFDAEVRRTPTGKGGGRSSMPSQAKRRRLARRGGGR